MSNNVQLYAYEGNTRYELDLYFEDSIKLNVSAETITQPNQIDSAFSRSFTIPATNSNSRFFKWWYVAGVVDFDVTQKVRAEIHVDGILYKKGQLRLLSAIMNEETDRIDFEVIFFGETKDFATQVGDLFMTDLDLVDSAHIIDDTTLQNSWLDFGNPSLLLDGKVRYIVADRGYEYDEDGNQLAIPNQTNPSEIIFVHADHPYSFEREQHALDPLQFTPIVQVKYLIDKIFERTSYTYDASSVFNESWFKFLYTDGIGQGQAYTPQSDARFEAEVSEAIQPIVDFMIVPFRLVTLNNANAYSYTTYKFTAPANGNYDLSFTIQGYALPDSSGQPPFAEARLIKNGGTIASDTATGGLVGSFLPVLNASGTFALNQGDEVWVDISFNFTQNEAITAGSFSCTASPSAIAVNDLMKPEVKQIDFFKSILTKFRLVMVPSITVDNQFIIKPWKDYIGTGQTFDWTYKLDYNKNVKIEPLFYDQTANIKFTDVEDIDEQNDYHQFTYGRVYGTFDYKNTNDLLKGTSEVTTIFAPTPVNAVDDSGAGSQFIIPKFYKFSEDQTSHGGVEHAQHEPIVPEPRLLFWNGMRTTGGLTWYWGDQTSMGSYAMTTYPCASYLSEIPSISTTLNLNWSKDVTYFEPGGGPSGSLGETVFDRYWKTYIDSIYSPDARKLTAYFNLDSNDLRDVTFDDIIFIKDSYWRVYKIVDAPLGEIASIKVELIKIL